MRAFRLIFRSVAAAVAVLCVVFVVPSVSVGAQEDCYPDGCTEPTNPPPPDDVSCGISLSSGQVGAEVTATIRNVPAGGNVRVLFDGTVVADSAESEQAFAIAGGPVFFRSPTQESSRDVTLTFTVPERAPGVYSVTAVGDTFTVTCGAGDGSVGFEVLAADATNTDDDDGSLAFTGLHVLLLTLVGLGLVVSGWALVKRSGNRATA